MASAPQKLQGLEYLALNLQFVLDVRKTALNSATLHTAVLHKCLSLEKQYIKATIC